MRRFLILASLAIIAVFALGAPADAAWRHRHHHHGIGLGFYFGVPGPYYYSGYPYYSPYYAPRPVVVNRPVYAVPPAGAVIREGRDSSGNYCREYQSNTSIDGRAVPTYGTACMRPDGSWQIVN